MIPEVVAFWTTIPEKKRAGSAEAEPARRVFERSYFFA
jgi:hypothetical protein